MSSFKDPYVHFTFTLLLLAVVNSLCFNAFHMVSLSLQCLDSGQYQSFYF